MAKSTALAIPILALSVAASAQTTHLVGPGGFPQIRDALAVAAPGDVILVQPGVYAHFTATVGVTIRAALPGTVDVEYQAAFAPPGCLQIHICASTQGPTTMMAPTGQTVHVVGLRFRPNIVPIGGTNFVRHRVKVTSGAATFDQCDFQCTDMSALAVTWAAVRLQQCTLQVQGTEVGSHALAAFQATVTASDCTFTGNSTQAPFYPPGGGIGLQQGSVLHGSDLVIQGGNALPAGIGGAAVSGDLTSSCWLADSVLTAGTGGCPMVAGVTGQLARCTLAPATPGCTTPPSGPVLGARRLGPLQTGTAFAIAHHTEPNALVVVFAASALGDASLPGILEPRAWLGLGAFQAGALFADTAGAANASWSIPAVPAFVDRELWFQAVSGLTLPLQAGPVLGGIVR